LGNSKTTGIFAGLGVTLVWSSWILATRMGLSTDLSIYDLLALRFGVACAVCLPFLLYLKAWKGLSWMKYSILAVLGGLPQNILTYEAIERSPIAHVTVFMYGTTPIITAAIAFILLRRKISFAQALGTAVIFCGIVLMTAEQFFVGIDWNAWIGNVMALGAIASFATFLIFADRWQISITQSIVACTVLNGFVYLPYWLFFMDSGLSNAPMGELMTQGALQGLIPGLLALFVTTTVSKTLGANIASLFFAMIPVSATAMAVPLLGEHLSLEATLGILLATCGIVIASMNWKTLQKSMSRYFRMENRFDRLEIKNNS